MYGSIGGRRHFVALLRLAKWPCAGRMHGREKKKTTIVSYPMALEACATLQKQQKNVTTLAYIRCMELLKDIFVNLLSDAVWALGGMAVAYLSLFKKNHGL